MILHLVHTPNTPNRGLTANEQCRRGREKLLNMTFAGYEERIRDQLSRMLGTGGSNHRVTSPPSPSIAGLSAGRLVSCRFASEREAALAMAEHLEAKLRKGDNAV